MPEPSPLAVPEPWNLIVDGYVDFNVPLFERYAADALRLARLQPAERVLDVAAGPGTLSLLAARTAQVSALDFSPAMVERLRARAEAARAQVEARVGDGMALPYADASFDAAFSMFGLMFFPDRGRGFAELARVLRPGGRAVVSAWVSVTRVPHMLAFFGALREEVPGLPMNDPHAPLSEPSDFEREMGAAGFVHLQVQEVVHAVDLPSTEALFQGMVRSAAPVAIMAQRLGEAKWRALAPALLSRMQAQLGTGPQRVAMPALLGLGRRPQ
ncbi:class I SAM-dependent methyltransferase [Aggregicoccus sp. 17bor-14]|uniref:class I SAM-dependent methyltransferase n=1 Tax=Myxococcaceae TaxID=31 RepID=UPI00129C3749|nr:MULTISPECIES: class I SAM-dependent methyltransferase [Myxococcaceae]MBF5046594.1 methyltransferase domain-containing protein [Simulacricoccus sp. 17bor-14]MRI92305.1 class I SAM-dependent methyltransferase [Aggregicoccus sp. 17bor-14]